MRSLVAVLFACLVVPVSVEARPSPYPADRFEGDRYVAVRTDVRQALKRPAVKQRRAEKARYLYRVRKAPRIRTPRAEPLTLAQGLRREIAIAGGLLENLDGLKRRVVGGPFIRGRLICAANVGAELARRGIRGTGSRLAMSYRNWGRASGPVPGAVAVFGRRGGGHVAIVHSVRPNGQVIYLNPSSRRQAWVIGPYGRRPIAYRVAG